MSNEFSLIINESGNIIWSGAENNSIQYIINDESIVDSTLNEGYVTAIDDSNSSQYFSVLETTNENDVTLEDFHNLTLENPKSVIAEGLIEETQTAVTEDTTTEESDSNTNLQDVAIFKIGDDLYGVQMFEDENGTLQKYKFKFRTTDDGQLEAIPESVEIVNENEILPHQETVAEAPAEVENGNLVVDAELRNELSGKKEAKVYVKGEVDSEPEAEEEYSLVPESDLHIEHDEHEVNIKQELVQNSKLRTSHLKESNAKQEFLSEITEENELVQDQEFHCNSKQEVLEDIAEDPLQIQNPKFEHFDSNEKNCQSFGADFQENVNEAQYASAEEPTYNCDNSESLVGADHAFVSCFQENVEEPTKEANVLSHEIVQDEENCGMVEEIQVASSEEIVYQQSEENILNSKENQLYSQMGQHFLTMDENEAEKISNPRSILKSSFVNTSPKGLIQVKRPKATFSQEVLSNDERYHNKRFARNREVQEAKQFTTFLNRTTVPQAPIRKNRLPRKQQIRTSNREDEEIIVQEVLVTSTGIVSARPSYHKLRKAQKMKVTTIVELSDSEEDSRSIANSQKRRKSKTSESPSESEVCLTETLIDENIENKPVAEKRVRGRPRKSEIKGRPPSASSEHSKKEIRCPFCPKTLPSQNSLNTHMHHHNLENHNLQNTQPKSTMPRQSLLPAVEYNHKCQECEQTFKNSILLQRHVCSKRSITYDCNFCSKKFADISVFNIHKKTHIKSTLVRNTSNEKISPKKMNFSVSTGVLNSPRKSVFKSPRKSVVPKKNDFKCDICSLICSSEASLKFHQKTHKKFTCSSCSATFTSKILLDTHVRLSCVKIRSPSNKRLSLKIRKSFINSPAKRMSFARFTRPNFNKTVSNASQHIATETLDQTVSNAPSTAKATLFTLECEFCKVSFSTYRNLYVHKVQKHGLSTPDKTLTAKPKKAVLYKAQAAHTGIPTNERMKKAYETLRRKLAETTVDMEMSSVCSN